jgi:hypothetical protein
MAEHAVHRRSEGRRSVAMRLRRAGVPTGIVDQVIGDVAPDDDGARALSLALARAGRLRSLFGD